MTRIVALRLLTALACFAFFGNAHAAEVKALHIQYRDLQYDAEHDGYYLLLGSPKDVGGVAVVATKKKGDDEKWSLLRGHYNKSVKDGKLHFDLTVSHPWGVPESEMVVLSKGAKDGLKFHIASHSEELKTGIETTAKLKMLPKDLRNEFVASLRIALKNAIEHHAQIKPGEYDVLPISDAQADHFRRLLASLPNPKSARRTTKMTASELDAANRYLDAAEWSETKTRKATSADDLVRRMIEIHTLNTAKNISDMLNQ